MSNEAVEENIVLTDAQWKQIEEAKEVSKAKPVAGGEGVAAARDALHFMLTVIVLFDRLSKHPPELYQEDDGAWGIRWDDGPIDWAVWMSLNESFINDDDRLRFDTTRYGFYAEVPDHGRIAWYAEDEGGYLGANAAAEKLVGPYA